MEVEKNVQPVSKYKHQKVWNMIKEKIEDHTIESIPFTYAKNICIVVGDKEHEVKSKKDFRDTISRLSTELGPDSENIKVKYKINYEKLVSKVETKTNKYFNR